MARDREDEFWQVALEDKGAHGNFISVDSDSEGNESSHVHTEIKEHFESIARVTTYKIPWKDVNEEENSTLSSISLKLSPLPDSDGIWSPLGAQAWHASSLLVAYTLQSTILKPINDKGTRLHKKSLLARHIDSWFAEPHTEERFRALELGSGAVGLAGIVMGLILSRCFSSMGIDKYGSSWITNRPQVILTDNEANVVKHLQQNVHNTLSWLAKDTMNVPLLSFLPDLEVQHLDWNLYQTSELAKQTQKLQLVFGSELVYTGETAKACINIVLEVLGANPDALVFILQVTDRDGWSNVFLPSLYKKPFLQVLEESMENSDLHELAGTIIPPGGTLDRFAFGGCYIFHKDGRVASNLISIS